MSSRKEQKEELRRQREEAAKAAKASSARRKTVSLIVAGFFLLALAALAVVIVSSGSSTLPSVKNKNLVKAAKVAGCVYKEYPYGKAGQHQPGKLTYAIKPPVEGPHSPTPAYDGSYVGAKVLPPTVNVVHALEHGRVVFLYHKGLASANVEVLDELWREKKYHVLLTQDLSGMKYEVAATAWSKALLCKTYTPAAIDALRDFRDAYRDQGPEDVPGMNAPVK